MTRSFLLAVLFFWVFFSARAQEKPVIGLDENSGLCDDEVREIILDHEDILWVGTNNGISAYDGDRFVCYRKSDGLAGNRVWGLAVDDRNRVYAGCYVGGSAGYVTAGSHVHGISPTKPSGIPSANCFMMQKAGAW